MAVNYDLNNTGQEVQERLDQVMPNKTDIEQEVLDRQSGDNALQEQINAINTEIGESGQGGETINGRLDGLESAVGSGGSVDERIADAKAEIVGGASEDYDTLGKVEGELVDTYRKDETYSKEQLDSLITTPDVEYVTVIAVSTTTDATTLLPNPGAADTVYRVGNWDGTQYDPTLYSLYAWDGSAYIPLAVRTSIGEVYDISVSHPDGQGNSAVYTDLANALGESGANVPSDIRKGGMSVKFIQLVTAKYSVVVTTSDIQPTGTALSSASSVTSGTYEAAALTDFSTLPSATGSGNAVVYYYNNSGTYTVWTITMASAQGSEYVQYRLMATDWSTTQSDWQGVDTDPRAGSRNLVESGGVYPLKSVINYADSINLFDKNNRIDGVYVRRDNGRIRSIGGSDYFTTDYIPIDVAGCYANYGVTGGTYLGYACYSDKSESSFTHGSSSKQAVYQDGTQNPSGNADAYVRFSGLLADLDKFMVVSGTSEDCPPVSEYVPYGKIGQLKDGIVSTDNIKDGAVTLEKIEEGVIPEPTEVADNLTTDDPLKALSAAQGKVIADATMELVEGINILDPTTIVVGKYVRKDNGNEAAVGSITCYGCTPLIPFTENVICNSCMQTTGNYVTGCVAFDTDGTSVLSYFGASSNGKPISVIKSEHPTWAYLRFNLYPNNGNQYAVYKGSSLPDEFIPYVNTHWEMKGVPDDSIGTEKLKDGAVSFEKISFTELEVGKNKLNPVKVTEGKYINRNTGQEASGNNLACTDFIPVSEKGLYCNYGYYGGAAIGGCAYDSNKSNPRSIGGTNGKVYTYQEGDAYVRFSLYSYNLSNAYVIEGTVAGEYEPYSEREVVSPDVLPTQSISADEFLSKANENKIFSNDIDVFLPDKIHAVVGDTLQLFFQGMAKCVDVSPYNTLVACNKGNQYRRYFQFTPKSGETGTISFNFYIKDNNGNILGHGASSIVTVNLPSSPSSNINILCVGDSVTAGGQWPGEFMRRLTANDGTPVGNNLSNITFVGSRLKNGVHYEGHSGYSWGDYATRGRAAFRFTISSGVNVTNGAIYSNNGHQYTVIEVSDNNTIRCSTDSFNNTPTSSGTLTKVSGSGDNTITFTDSAEDSQNPFWDAENEKLSFTKYATQYCNSSIDVIYVLLGGNALFTNQMNNVRAFIDAFHTDFPNGKVKLMGIYVPSMKLMMPGYGASGSLYANTYGVLCRLKDQARDYQALANEEGYSSFVEYVDVACQLDSDYNFPVTQKDVNTRNSSVTEPYANNTLHASPSGGYMQIADVAYRNFVANYCQ